MPRRGNKVKLLVIASEVIAPEVIGLRRNIMLTQRTQDFGFKTPPYPYFFFIEFMRCEVVWKNEIFCWRATKKF